MKNRIFLLFTIVIFLWSCNDENLDLQNKDVDSSTENNTSQTFADNEFVCSTIVPSISDSISGRVSYRGTYWDNGQTITIKFLNGSSSLQNKVRTYANEWTRYANVRFQWVGSNQNADIKISFENYGSGGRSHVGTGSKGIAQNQPSMWFYNIQNYSNNNIKRVVLHEFGHALGLGHEHQNPTAKISWNREEVYKYYTSIGWSRADVDEFIFKQFNRDQVDFGYFDPNSIMNYSIPARFTTNGVSYPTNYVLSTFDRTSIGMMYPFSRTGNSRPSLYMYWNPYYGDHLCTNNWRELGNGGYGYRFDRTLGYLDSTPGWDNIQLHRYYSPWTGDHFYTTNFNEMGDARYGYYYEGSMGYVKRTQVAGSLPLYRYWNVRLGDHFYTTDWNELGQSKSGWVFEKIEGYVVQ